jgi:DNA-binding MurR/RpiR family transcriptional regulator
VKVGVFGFAGSFAVFFSVFFTGSFVDSFAAPLSLINALLVALGQRRRTEVSQYFEKMERIWAEYDVYLAKTNE